MNIEHNKATATTSGILLAGLILLAISGLVIKNQSETKCKCGASLTNKLGDLPNQEWYKAIKQWLFSCPCMPSINLKPFNS